MKKTTLFKFAFILFVGVALSACSKYEEGSNFSLISAKARLANTWTSTSYEQTTSAGTSTNNDMLLTIEKDGSYYVSESWGGLIEFNETGTWTFNDDKTQLLLDYNGSITTWDIIKLKNKELKLTRMENILGTDITFVVELEGQ